MLPVDGVVRCMNLVVFVNIAFHIIQCQIPQLLLYS